MLVTAFTWGLGVSCGAAIGLLSFFVCKTLLDWLFGNRETAKLVLNLNRESLEQLKIRNELTEDTNWYLSKISEALEGRNET